MGKNMGIECTGVLRLGLLIVAENVGKHWGLKKLGNLIIIISSLVGEFKSLKIRIQ